MTHRRRLAALIALCFGCWSGMADAAPTLPPAVGALLDASGLPRSSFGIEVRAVDAGQATELVALNADEPFLLASTTKLVTSLVALDLLGPGHRWQTHAIATGPVVGGRLAGNLVIRGGEVGLTAGELRRWFVDMRAEGLEQIDGNIVLQHVALLHERDPAQAPTTAEERQADLPAEARAYNHGKLLVTVEPAGGARAHVRLSPAPANVVLVNDVQMGGGCAAWARWRSAEETGKGAPLQLWVRGRWSAECGRDDIAWVPAPDGVRLAPRLGAAPMPIAAPRLVAELWSEAGGRLRGRVVETAESVRARPAGHWTSTVATPLTDVVREMNKTSNNAAARSLLLSLGTPAPSAGATLLSAQARVRTWLHTQGVDDGDIRVDVGSGQSRAERGKPRALVHLLCNAWRSSDAQAFVDSLPIAGVDGTLVHRLRTGAASGQAWLKTGTLHDTRALAGYVRGRSGTVYAVAAIVTHPEARRGLPTLDALIEWLARER
jgi:D-alanyl-D-alanine carboxypeptidase/D-alanyl-D-alanine-endopeptidase (penicillin-binding protein 4)